VQVQSSSVILQHLPSLPYLPQPGFQRCHRNFIYCSLNIQCLFMHVWTFFWLSVIFVCFYSIYRRQCE